jgi:DNA repair protein RecO (recombination protein O)
LQRIRTEAIVLRRVAFREADLVLTLFTRTHGKLSALARAARASQRRFGGGLGLLAVLEVEISRRPGSELATLGGATLKQSFARLASDLAAFAHASYATELTRELIPAEQPDVGAFDLLIELYVALAAGASRSLLRAFELRLLAELGLAPVFDRCAVCGASGAELERRALFDPDRGGAVCARCGASSRGVGVRPLVEPARQLLLRAQRAPSLASAQRLAVSPPQVEMDARDLILALLGHHLGKPLKSLEFVRQLSS